MLMYIQNLVNNIPQREKPLVLDVVLEGGAFNGAYLYGALQFLKELKKKNHVIIRRMSGCSIGAILAFLFSVNKLEQIEQYYVKLRNHLQKHLNIKITKKLLERIMRETKKTEFNKIKSGVLYISYYDAEKKKLIVQSKFQNKNDLLTAILRSSHFPLLVDGKCLKHKKYLDGFVPYIFSQREKRDSERTLYLTINRFSQLKGIFNTRFETSMKGRALEGALDAYNFFLHGKETKICSYVDQWTTSDFTKIRIKQFLTVVLVWLIDACVKINKVVSPHLQKLEIYNRILPILNEYYRDLVLLLCF
tara:strand:+ start:2158 stop:3072 length:915 start_codon:yes stop_codon:yes gene_type:complete